MYVFLFLLSLRHGTGWGNQVTAFSAIIDNDDVVKTSSKAMVWVKYVYPDGAYRICHEYFNRLYKEVTILYLAAYDSDGNVRYSCYNPYGDDDKKPIVPNSVSEGVYYYIW